MREMWNAIGRSRFGVPLWVVAASGILAGAIVAQESRSSHAAEPPPVIAPVVTPAGAQAAPAAGTPAVTAPAARPSGITFLDSARPAEPSAPAANAPAATPRASSSGGFERIGIMLVILIGGIVALAFWKRRKEGPGKATPQLSLVGQVRVAGRWSVALVKVPGKTLVLGATDKGLTLLSTLDEDGTSEDADPLADLIEDDEPVATMRAAPPRTAPRHPPQPPLPQTSAEPFSRLLDQLTGSTGLVAAGEPPQRSGEVRNTRPGAHNAYAARPDAARPDAPGPQRERLLTPQADALRARLERFQTPSA